MLNRVLQVKLVKKDKPVDSTAGHIDKSFEGKAAIIGHFFVESIEKIGAVVITYIVLDTARQVLVVKAEK